MNRVLDLAKTQLEKSNCRAKATVKLGSVSVSESSGYTIQAKLEYLVYPRYKKWDFATCVANENILQDMVDDPTKAPSIQGQYSSYSATNVTKDSTGLKTASTCCNPGSVLRSTYCGMFFT